MIHHHRRLQMTDFGKTRFKEVLFSIINYNYVTLYYVGIIYYFINKH